MDLLMCGAQGRTATGGSEGDAGGGTVRAERRGTGSQPRGTGQLEPARSRPDTASAVRRHPWASPPPRRLGAAGVTGTEHTRPSLPGSPIPAAGSTMPGRAAEIQAGMEREKHLGTLDQVQVWVSMASPSLLGLCRMTQLLG